MLAEHRKWKNIPTGAGNENLCRTRTQKEYITIIEEWAVKRHTHNPAFLVDSGATQVERSFPYSPPASSNNETTTPTDGTPSVMDLSDGEESLNGYGRRKKRKISKEKMVAKMEENMCIKNTNETMKIVASASGRLADAVTGMFELLKDRFAQKD